MAPAGKFSDNKQYDVVGFGLNAVDQLFVLPHYPAFNSKVRIKRHEVHCGGQVATALATCARFGLKCKYIGKVGSDEFGRVSLESIKQEGIDASSVIVEPGAATQYAFIIIDERNGERTILWDRDPKLMFREGELSREAICSGKLLHLDGHDLVASVQAVKWAHAGGGLVSIDIDKVEERTDELIEPIDFLIGTAGFFYELTGINDIERALRKVRQLNKNGFLCATLGADGSMALSGELLIHAAGYRVPAVDTTGAGDVFHGAFIYGLFQGWDAQSILKFANATAALSCAKIGARSGIPTLDEVKRLVGQ